MTDQQEYRLTVYRAVEKLKRERKLDDESVIAYFTGEGVTEKSARANLRFYYGVEQQRLRRNSRRDVLSGAMVLAAGLVLRSTPLLADAPALMQWALPVAGAALLAFGLWGVARGIQAGLKARE